MINSLMMTRVIHRFDEFPASICVSMVAKCFSHRHAITSIARDDWGERERGSKGGRPASQGGKDWRKHAATSRQQVKVCLVSVVQMEMYLRSFPTKPLRER